MPDLRVCARCVNMRCGLQPYEAEAVARARERKRRADAKNTKKKFRGVEDYLGLRDGQCENIAGASFFGGVFLGRRAYARVYR